MAQHVAVLSHSIQHLQGAVPGSRAVLTNTSPELVLATGAQRAGRDIASAWHSRGPHGYREAFKYTLKGQMLGDKDSSGTGTLVILWRSGDFQPGFGELFCYLRLMGWHSIAELMVLHRNSHLHPRIVCVCIQYKLCSRGCPGSFSNPLGVAKSCKEVCTL